MCIIIIFNSKSKVKTEFCTLPLKHNKSSGTKTGIQRKNAFLIVQLQTVIK